MIYYLIITSILMVGQTQLEKYYGRGFDDDQDASTKKSKFGSRQQMIAASGTVKDQINLDVTP